MPAFHLVIWKAALVKKPHKLHTTHRSYIDDVEIEIVFDVILFITDSHLLHNLH
jgi:hypothetical protein